MNKTQLKTYLIKSNSWQKVLFGLPIFLVIIMLLMDHSGDSVELGQAVYRPEMRQQRLCKADQHSGNVGETYGEETENGIKYNVRTPANYDASVSHPLLLVFSPAGSNRAKTEKTTGFTFPATQAGFIVAYADHPDLSPSTTVELSTIPSLIAKKWCIDEKQIYLTGHSDGGTSAMALAFMAGTLHIPHAIAPSAAGVAYDDLRDRECPKPLAVMVMHSSKDRLFPGYGQQSAGWWATCNKCDPIPDKIGNGCFAYSGCADGVKTWYCEGDQIHSAWPDRSQEIIDFFVSVAQVSPLNKLK